MLKRSEKEKRFKEDQGYFLFSRMINSLSFDNLNDDGMNLE